jgi:type II secretory pathway predicted ATPase ExeA
MDYLKFYELAVEPFRNDPDVAFFFESRGQRAARMRLLRGVSQHRGLCVLVGAPGLGKTMLARQLLASLDGPERCVRMLGIPHRDCDAGWLLPRISSAFGVAQVAPTALGALGQIYERLSGLGAAGRHPVLLVDEAQLLENPRVMEEFRGLLNLEDADRKLLSLVLFGLPDLDRVLRLDESLAQRVDIRVTLEGLAEDEIADYLEHRLKRAGAARPLFTGDAVEALWTWTHGVPRLVNTLADNALFEGALAGEPVIDAAVVVSAAQQLGLADLSDVDAAGDTSAQVTVPVVEPPRPVAPFGPAAHAPAPAPAHGTPAAPRPLPTPIPVLKAQPRSESIAIPISEEIGVELEPTLPTGEFAAPVEEAEIAEVTTPDADLVIEEDVSIEFAAVKSRPAEPQPDPEEELAARKYSDTTQESLVDLIAELDDDEAATIAPGVPATPKPAAPAAPAAPVIRPAGAPAAAAATKADDENVDLDALFEDIQIQR